MSTEQWIDRIIDGPGGLRDYEQRDGDGQPVALDKSAAVWTLNCLSNILCEGGDKMMAPIEAARFGLREYDVVQPACPLCGCGDVVRQARDVDETPTRRLAECCRCARQWWEPPVEVPDA